MFRIGALRDIPAALLSNQDLLPLLASLPVSAGLDATHEPGNIDPDVIAWEFFRQLVSPAVDPIDPTKVTLLGEMLRGRKGEISRLRNRCYQLGRDLRGERSLGVLVPRVRETIRASVANDLQDLLRIDKKTLSDFLTKIFSDEKNWVAIASFIGGLLTGGEALTAGAAIYGLSTVGAAAFKEAAQRREKLSTNAYTLLYRMGRNSGA
jgi:hypothetical protein